MNIPISKLKPNTGQITGLPKNPRFIKDARFEQLKQSLADLPMMTELRELIVVPQNGHYVTLGGNMRLRAAKDLGWKEMPCKVLPENTPVETLAEIVVKDNVPFGQDDFDILANEWTDFPLAEWGMEGLDFEVEEEPKDAEPQLDKAVELNKKWKVKTGDLWQIGEHRLLCGSCTDKADVDRVMDGSHAQLCLTDPPYAVDEHYDQHDDTEQNLAVLAAEFMPIAQGNADVVLLTPGNSNQWMYQRPDWTLAWFVPAGVGRSGWGFSCWQPVLAFGADPYLKNGKGCRPDALNLTEAADNETGHPCSKPIKVWGWFLERGSVNKGDLVYEPFAGSGTTLVACQNLNRKCYAIEISENYCAVILERMATAFPELEIKRVDG